MSGIAGIIRFDGAPVEPGLVVKMTTAMSYRGPDGINHWVKGNVALGQCMLRTTSESLEETQPLTNEDESLVMVMDGRVDNWEELRKELLGRGAILRSRADAELVLRAYETWGKDCVNRIDGDFALVIWDAHSKTAFCARDRMGNKPFNYHWDGKTFVFASELHPIFALPWVSGELNEGMLAECLAAEWYSRDETFWLGIMRLVASHRMEVGTGGPNPERYWMPDLWLPLSYAREEEYVEHYRQLFADTVRRTSRSHRVLACEVSGGLDSSAIYAMAQHLLGQGTLPAPSLEGYTLDFHDDPAADELEYAQAVGRHWGKEILEVPPAKMPISWYRDWVSHYMECPPYPNGTMGLGVREEARARGSRVLLAGVGGDEWLWGDRDYYAGLLASSQWKLLLESLKTDASEAGLYTSIWWLLRFGMAPLLPGKILDTLRKIGRSGNFKSAGTQRWLAAPMLTILKERRTKYRFSSRVGAANAAFRSRILMLNSAISTLARESEERLAASVGMEVRLPFWDRNMVQFAFSVPSQLRLRGNTDRALHRKAMIGLLPEEVLARKTKANFMITYQKGLSELKDDLTVRVAGRRADWVNPQGVARLYQRCNRADLGWWPEWQLWTLFGCDCLADTLIKPELDIA